MNYLTMTLKIVWKSPPFTEKKQQMVTGLVFGHTANSQQEQDFLLTPPLVLPKATHLVGLLKEWFSLL